MLAAKQDIGVTAASGGVVDKAGVDYWNNVWSAKPKPTYRPEAPENIPFTRLLRDGCWGSPTMPASWKWGARIP